MPPVMPPRVPVVLLPPGEPAPAPPPPRPVLGRRAIVLIAVLLLAVGVSVYWVSRPPAAPPPARPAIEEAFHEVDLGVFSRPFAADAAGLLKEEFVVRVVLVLNPKYGDPARVRPLVERRRNHLRHIVTVDVIHALPEADLIRLENLQVDIRNRLNRALGGARDGHEVIQEALFPEAIVPRR